MRSPRLPRLLAGSTGRVGLVLVAVPVLAALLGPLLTSGDGAPVGLPGAPPGDGALLGTDFLGRDVVPRVLHGGLSVLLLSSTSTVIAYAAGLVIGLVAAYGKAWVDWGLMRAVDVLLTVPPLVVLLLIITGFGTKVLVLLIGVCLIQLPGIARVVRSATQQVVTSGYVEAAVARGERLPAILGREILPNIAPVVIVDLGLRFGLSVLLVASMSFLGLGFQPPKADWGLMIAENRAVIGTNPWASIAPGVLLALLLMGINLLGDALAQVLGHSRGAVAINPGGVVEVSEELVVAAEPEVRA